MTPIRRIVWVALGALFGLGLAWLIAEGLPARPARTGPGADPRIVYLQETEAGSRLLASPAEGPGVVLLEVDRMITSFAVSPAGDWLAYSLENQSGGQDLWILGIDEGMQNQVLDCSVQVCTDPAWSPDGQRLAFTRRGQGLDPLAARSRVWTVSVSDGQAAPLFQDETVLGYLPVWSPDGLGLAFYDPQSQAIRILDLDTGREHLVRSGSGRAGGWSPDGSMFVLPQFEFDLETARAALAVLDLETRALADLIPFERGWLDLARPVWGPDGVWIAFAGQSPGSGLAKGLYLIRPDGSGLRSIAAAPGVTHGRYAWDPEGEMLVYQSFRLDDPEAKPRIAVWHRSDGRIEIVAEEGHSPAWLP